MNTPDPFLADLFARHGYSAVLRALADAAEGDWENAVDDDTTSPRACAALRDIQKLLTDAARRANALESNLDLVSHI